MAAYISFQPSAFYNTKLYTGTGSSNALTGLGFQPDMVWVKGRDYAYNHVLSDSVRGEKQIYPNLTNAQDSNTGEITSFDSDGFTVGTGGDVNYNTRTFAAWNWKAGTTSGITTDGSTTITPSAYSFNQTAGISIIQYAGNSTSGAKLAHGLGVQPNYVMIKRLTSAGANWQVPSTSLELNFDWVLKLDTADAYADDSGFFADTAPDAVNITLGDDSGTNTGHDYIAYVFASKKGFSKVGGYYGSGNTNGPFVYTGFRPAFLMIKQTAGANDWVLYDSARMPFNGNGILLKPNVTAVEADNSTWASLDLLSNGFKPRGTDGVSNGTDLQYLYIAFAEFPIVSSNSKAGTAR